MLLHVFDCRIFVVKLFCGPFVGQSLMLNRRNDHEDKKMHLLRTHTSQQ